jgi:outer membrane immunogenic protein
MIRHLTTAAPAALSLECGAVGDKPGLAPNSSSRSGCRLRRLIVASLTAAGLNFGFGAAAPAADLPRPAPAPIYLKAPVAPTYNWTGFYIGGNAGWVREVASGTSDFVDTGVLIGASEVNPQSNSPSNSGFIGGGQLGYNWQVARQFVLGAEGDWDWLNTRYSFCRQTNVVSIACVDKPGNPFGFESIGSQTNWLATARARAGVTWDRYMAYGTGGAAWGSFKTTESLSCLNAGCGSSSIQLAASSSITQTQTGWVAGLGVEGMLSPNWTVKAEWLHYDFGNLSDTFTTVGTRGTQSVVWSRDERFDAFRVGVNYLFR